MLDLKNIPKKSSKNSDFLPDISAIFGNTSIETGIFQSIICVVKKNGDVKGGVANGQISKI